MDLSGGFNFSSGSRTHKGKTTAWTTDGTIDFVKGKIVTQGATQTSLKIGGDTLDVQGADLTADGIIRGYSSVSLNGTALEKNCEAGIDLAKLDGALGNAYKPPQPGFFRRLFRLG